MNTTSQFSYRRSLIAIALLLSLAWQALAAAPAAAAPALDPAAGGLIWVADSHDNSGPGFGLSLREAILIANGGTGATGLNRPLFGDEVLALVGCTFNASGNITGGCGAGFTDTIQFYANAIDNYIRSDLPDIDDTAPLHIPNQFGADFVTVRQHPDEPQMGYVGLTIASDSNAIAGLKFQQDSCPDAFCGLMMGIYVSGSGNILDDITVLGSKGYGIYVDGWNNWLTDLLVGAPSANSLACLAGYGNSLAGIYLSPNAVANVIEGSVIGCNKKAGVEVYGSSNRIGPNNSLGVNQAGTGPLGNWQSGLRINAGFTTVISNTVAFNGWHGISLTGQSHKVGGNTLRHNGWSGLSLQGNTWDNLIGGPQAYMPYGGNKIAGNGEYGIELVTHNGNDPHDNKIAGNWVGTLNGTTATPNLLDGILLDRAYNNTLGQPTAANVIAGNQGNGIRLKNYAHDNLLVNNYVGRNQLLPLPNELNGLVIETGSHHNTVGQAGLNLRNYFDANGQAGILIYDNAANNTLVNNNVAFNTGHGIYLWALANYNTIGADGAANWIHDNGQTGVMLEWGAHDNLIGSNDIYDNGLNGIRENNGAHDNWWTHVSLHDNTGEGIAKQAAMLVPAIAGAAANNGVVQAHGTASPDPGSSGNVLVELYVASGDGEGWQFLGSNYADGTGNWLIVANGPTGCYTAFQTLISLPNNTRTSSKFAGTFCAQPAQGGYSIFLPVLVGP